MKKIPSAAQYKVALQDTWDRLQKDKRRTRTQKNNLRLLLNALYEAPYHEASCQEIARKMEIADVDYSDQVAVANKVMGPMRTLGRLLLESLRIVPDVYPKPEGNTECSWAAFSSCDGDWPTHMRFRLLDEVVVAIQSLNDRGSSSTR